MKNRLVFSSNNIVYEWNKYNAITNYKWEKRNVLTSYLYSWDKFATTSPSAVIYYWEKYNSTLTSRYYSFHKTEITPTTIYIWGKYNTVMQTEITPIGSGSWDWIYILGFGAQNITLYVKPSLESEKRTFQYGEDYGYDTYYTDPYIYCWTGTKWYQVDGITMGGSGTQAYCQEITLEEREIEAQGSYISNAVSETSTTYPNNGKHTDGFWYHYTGSTSTTFYSATAELGNYEITGTLSKSTTLPQIDRSTGLYTISSMETLEVPYYAMDSALSTSYYVITADTVINGATLQNALKVSSASFNTGTVSNIDDYIGISTMNGSYYQVFRNSEYIKGSYIEDVQSEDRSAYPDNGVQGEYWYQYKSSSSTSGYIWKKYNLETSTTTTYHWNYYLPKYKWKRYNYTTRYVSNPLSTNQILWYKITSSGSYSNTIARLQFNGADMDPQVSIDIHFSAQNPAANRLYPNGSSIVELRATYTNGYITLHNILPDAATLTNQNTVYLDNATNIKLYMDDSLKIYIYGELVSQKDSFIDYVYSNDRNTYPDDGAKDDYYYEYDSQEQGDFVGQVSSTNHNDYSEGWSGAFYYVEQSPTTETTYSKGTYIEEVQDASMSTYPANGAQDGFWYVYDRNVSNLEKGDFLEKVYSNNQTQYPQDGVANDNYWYVATGSTPQYSKGELIGYVNDTNQQAYPNDGKLENYWYVANGSFYSQGDFISTIQNFDANFYPQNGEQGGFWYVYSRQTRLTLDTLYDSDLFGGVKYAQDVNSGEELMFGMAAGASITFDMNNKDARTGDYLGATVDYYVQFMEDTEETHIGSFIVSEVHKNRDRATITALDVLSKFDEEVDSWIGTIGSNITVQQLTNSLGSHIGVPIILDNSIVNKDAIIGKNYSRANITARTVLQDVAEMCGGFAVADLAGNVIVRTYKETNKALTNANYRKLTIADYQVAPIDKVNVANAVPDGSNVVVGSGKNAYLVQDNGLMYSTNRARIEGYAQALYDLISQFTYTPTTIILYKDFGINCGDIITVDGVSTFVQSKTIDASGVKFSCSGVEKRNAQYNEISTKLNEISGQVNSLSNEVSNLSETVDNVDTIVASIDQRVDSIRLDVSNSSNHSTIDLDIDGITVSSKVIEMNGLVEFTDLSTQGATVINGGNITTDSIHFNQLHLLTTNGSNSANIGSAEGSTGVIPTQGLGMFVKDSTQNVGSVMATPSGAKLSYDAFTGYDNEVSVYSAGARMAYGVGTGTGGNPLHRLEVLSTGCYSDGSIISTSDRNRKKDISYDLQIYENLYKDLKPARYKVLDGQSDRDHIGFVAQDVAEAIVNNGLSTQQFAGYCEWYDDTAKEATCGLRYEEFIAMNTMMIQKLLQKIETLENRITELEEQQ